MDGRPLLRVGPGGIIQADAYFFYVPLLLVREEKGEVLGVVGRIVAEGSERGEEEGDRVSGAGNRMAEDWGGGD